MKTWILFLALSICSITQAQTASGLYTGRLYNDSIKQYQDYELALSEYKGKISGWAYVTFVRNDSLFYGIRRIRGVQNGNTIVFQDDQFVANNFPEAPAKGVKRTYTFTLTGKDTVESMEGKWQTNSTKKYYAVPGTASLQRTSDSSNSTLINHLKELGWKGDYNNEAPVVAKTEKSKQELKPEVAVVKNATKKVERTQSPATSINTTNATPTTLTYIQRSNKLAQTIATTSDSLTLSFYDNGVVDGDVISVYINGEAVLEKTKLTELAVKKSVAVKQLASGDVTLTLVAETLGTLPPNTGLLVVQDGDVKHQIRFSADLQTNATIVFKKRQ